MFVNAKLQYNGTEVTVLDNFTLNFENCPDFANCHGFYPKIFPGGVPKPQQGCSVIKNFPGGCHLPSPALLTDPPLLANSLSVLWIETHIDYQERVPRK